jgi:hypothetical protein
VYSWPVLAFSSGDYNLCRENTGDGGDGLKRMNPRSKKIASTAQLRIGLVVFRGNGN